MNKGKQIALLVAGFAFFFVGLATTIGWNVLGWVGGSRLSSTEFPLGDHLVVAADSLGRIYVGDAFYDRVQRYSLMGQFECGWFLDTQGAVFVLQTTTDNRVEVAAARRVGLLIYTADGRLLSHVTDDDAYSRYSALPDISGQYKIKGWLLPCVVDMRTGRAVVATSWAKRFVAAPFPSFAYGGLGVALIAVSEWQRRRGRARLRASSSL